MEKRQADAIKTVEAEFTARRFDEAARLAVAAIELAARVSTEDAREVAQGILKSFKLQPIFRNAAEVEASGVFYDAVGEAIERVLGADDLLAAQYRVLRAGPMGVGRRYSEAAELLERSLKTLETQLGLTDPRTMNVRENLAIWYRNGGEPAKAEALYANIGVCEHLEPVGKYLRDAGVKVLAVSRPWSQNCRTWVYFANVVLDLASLRKRLNLPACVVDHVHRGTVDGAEQGLYCQTDHDGVMGMHTDMADASVRRIG